MPNDLRVNQTHYSPKVPYDARSLFQYTTPTHSLLVGMYIAYVTSYVVLAASRAGSQARFDSFLLGCVQDLRRYSLATILLIRPIVGVRFALLLNEYTPQTLQSIRNKNNIYYVFESQMVVL